MAKFPEKKYARTGINIVGCEYCKEVAIFIPITMKMFAKIGHSCSEKIKGTCRHCGIESEIEFIRVPGPAFINEDEARAIKGRLAYG
jgi:hypothetical protein